MSDPDLSTATCRAHANCRTCDVRIEVRAEDPDQALLERRGRAKQLGWTILRGHASRTHACYICPTCVAEIALFVPPTNPNVVTVAPKSPA